MSDYSIYPHALDGYEQLPLFIDNVTEVDAIGVNRLRSAIVNIEKELGVKPSDGYKTVTDRLDSISSITNKFESHLTDNDNPHSVSLQDLIGGTIEDLDNLLSNYQIMSHSHTHENGGNDQINADNLFIQFEPMNYLVYDDNLSDHLYGIDEKIGINQSELEEAASMFLSKLDLIKFHLEIINGVTLPEKDSAAGKLDDIILLFSIITGF